MVITYFPNHPQTVHDSSFAIFLNFIAADREGVLLQVELTLRYGVESGRFLTGTGGMRAVTLETFIRGMLRMRGLGPEVGFFSLWEGFAPYPAESSCRRARNPSH